MPRPPTWTAAPFCERTATARPSSFEKSFGVLPFAPQSVLGETVSVALLPSARLRVMAEDEAEVTVPTSSVYVTHAPLSLRMTVP